MTNRICARLKLLIAALILCAPSGIMPEHIYAFSNPAAVEQSDIHARSGQKTHELVFKLNGVTIRFVLTTGMLGLAVIALLTLLLGTAVLLAVVAGRRARHLQRANRQLEKEISERQRSEEELRKALEFVHGVAETAPLAMSAIDLEGRVTFWNPASERLFGWSAAEVTGQQVPIIPGNRRQDFEGRLQLYKQRHALRNLEVEYIRKDGTLFDASLWTAPLTDSEGKVVGMIGITVDITERKRANEQLRLSELRFRQLADSMPQIVWTASQDGRIEYLNQRWYQFSGYMPSNHLTEDVHSMMHSEDVAAFLTGWESAVRTQAAYEAECRLSDHQTGGYRWFLCRAIPASDSVTNTIRWFGTFTDIHEQKRMEAAFRRANEDLNRFAYSTNHDLQEPLRNLSSYSQLLEKRYSGYLDTEGTSFVRFIARDAQRMCALITNLTVYTSAGNASEPSRATADANSALGKALLNLQKAVSETHAVVVHTGLPLVRVAENELREVFQNLIQNAIQYRKAGLTPRVDISAQHKGAEWIFSVQDNGIGIAREYIQQIFGVFKRLHGAGQYGSIGMGLAICRKIIEHHGGRIWAESQPGVGSIFHFSLPAAAPLEVVVRRQDTSNPV